MRKKLKILNAIQAVTLLLAIVFVWFSFGQPVVMKAVATTIIGLNVLFEFFK